VIATPVIKNQRETTAGSGVFAAGDVRLGSTKRVASAVGEGAMAVQFVHEYLRVMGLRGAGVLLSPSDRLPD